MSVRTLSLPAEAVGLHIIASVSGGKDSTALILALREAGIGARYDLAPTASVWKRRHDVQHELDLGLGAAL